MSYIPTCGVDSTTMVPIKVISIPKLPVATLTFRSPDAQMLGDGPSLLALKWWAVAPLQSGAPKK